MCGGIKIIILHISPQYGTFYHYTGVDGVAAWAVHNASLIAITRKFEFMNYYSAPYEYMLITGVHSEDWWAFKVCL